MRRLSEGVQIIRNHPKNASRAYSLYTICCCFFLHCLHLCWKSVHPQRIVGEGNIVPCVLEGSAGGEGKRGGCLHPQKTIFQKVATDGEGVKAKNMTYIV